MKNSQILIHWSSRWKKICLHAKNEGCTSKGSYFMMKYLSASKLSKLWPLVKKGVRSMIWNWMILTSLIHLLFLPKQQQESVKILVCTWLLFDYLHFISIYMATVVNHNCLQNLFCIFNILHVPFISLPKWLETAMQSFKFLLKLWKNRFIENNMTFLWCI